MTEYDKAIEILKDTENKLKFLARDDKLKQIIENTLFL